MLVAIFLGLTVSAAAICDDKCLANCTDFAKKKCLSTPGCAGIYQFPEYDPASPLLLTEQTYLTKNCSMCTSGGSYYWKLAPNGSWIGGLNYRPCNHCVGAGYVFNCWIPPSVPNDCKTRAKPKQRSLSVWQPSFNETEGEQLESTLKAYPRAFTHVSPTYAFWNNKWNAKCNNSNHGLCYETFPPNVWATTRRLKATLGIGTIPIVETCCVCVLNATYDYMPAMRRLTQDLVDNHFDGIALDMVCGGADQPGRRQFLDDFARLLHPLNKTVAFWSHYRYQPEGSFPNAGDWVYTMDSYALSQRKFVKSWVDLFQCQAGVGLEYPGDGNATSIADMFSWLATSDVEAAGVWGMLPPADTDPIAKVYWEGFTQLNDAWNRAA
eukprot:TRINITY_DN2068_c0_g1_i1.p1 TRINITY_DN2068_c0_g1~~TRINITY_DN2068_c0_g1_i1.p1  ORF type:complete len:381 (+),score=38.82 TRINITY_DN2068_c0_g1_i1:112-1254(+)